MPEIVGRPLRLLHLEDDPTDAALVAETLRADGIRCEIASVATREAFERALADVTFDVILADYQLPSFDGLTAQTISAERAPDVPFIFVSGTLGEEIAIERMKSGALDYVLKQRISRLPSSVRRALSEARARKEKQHAENELRQLNAELDARVARRTSELAVANEALATQERQLRESEARLQAVLDHSPAAISVKDLDGRLVLVNRKFEEAVGRPAADVLGRTHHDLFPARLAEIYQHNDSRVLETGSPAEFEEPAVHNGAVHVYSSSKFALADASGRPYAVCSISLDVTERRHAEEAVKISAREAERANRAKSDFLSRMSHDLRTPLNAILGFAQVLEIEPLTTEQADNVRQILRGGRHLLEMINEVLDISRIEVGHLSLSPEAVGVAEVVQHAVDLVRPLAERQGLTLHVEKLDSKRYVRADRQRLTQVLLNLMSNAIKYNRPAGSVTIGCSEHPDGRFRIAVTDTGYGIPREKLGLLFQPFERLGAEQSQVEGTGLGLSLSKALAEAMGGALDVQTTIDVGSTFWVELATVPEPRIVSAPSIELESRAPIDPNGVQGTVLYIEDNSANVTLIERVLGRRPGVKLIAAANGSIGVECARTHLPNLIFLDLHLPDLPGEEVLRRLWEDPVTRPLPVVILTGDATTQQERRLRACGAVGYLTKPFNIARVLDTVDTYVGKNHEQSETGTRTQESTRNHPGICRVADR